MPPRPLLLLRSLARQPSTWTCHRYTAILRPHRVSHFNTTALLRSDSLPNHYETLDLSSTATPAEIKRQFYALSKQHHPDRNPEDPTASTRFVEISEAYHTLSIPEKRAKYDAHIHQSERRSGARGHGYPQGSHSSAAYGSRPASGLNKKRSTFRGPPPSFYNSGGYGRHGAKRAEHAHHDPHAEGQEKAAPDESYGDFGKGFGPGQQKQGHEVPHFDDRRHKETHDSVNEHIWARRRKFANRVRLEEEYAKGDMLVNFVMVTGVIGLIGLTVKFFGDRNEAQQKKRKDDL
ncbi:DnaJ-domain-containing protein [Ophiobolus disseminans]|uniref:DnaJ-domain-containing protein n=1 Tax=Ophiobolus disseminans TaxID=1469910 RepID=A0A6A7AKQ0_9PLEO|nr:DnaJ-domain-containing protein [Ophiobolus disseminans]